MARAEPTESDLAHLYQQFAQDLAQARTLAEGVAQCLALLEVWFSPQLHQLVWVAGETPRLLGPPDAGPAVLPDNDLRSWLANGDLALLPDHGQPSHCWIPLRARGTLLGWMFLQEPRWSSESMALLQHISTQAGPVLALLEAEERQQERIVQLQTLTEIGRLLSGVLDLSSLLDAIYKAAQQVLDVPNFYIALYDPVDDLLSLSYCVRDGMPWSASARWPPTSGLTKVLLEQRKPLVTNDYLAECQRRGIAPLSVGDLPFGRSWIGVPLYASDHFIGVMTVSSPREDYSYRPEHGDLLATIGAQAAVAIENARLYQRSELQTRQLATLNRIGRTINSSLDPEQVPSLIIKQVCELLEVEEGSLLLVDQQTDELVFAYVNGPYGSRLLGQRLPSGTGFAGYVVTRRTAVISNNVQDDPRFNAQTDRQTGFVTRTLLAVPLWGMHGVQGVIEVMNRRNRLFTRDDQRLLEAVADQAVIALENANRFAQVDQALARRAQELVQTNNQLQHNLRSLTALNALGMAINTTLRGADEIFSMTASGVVEMTGAQGACVLLLENDRFSTAVRIGRTPEPALLETAVHDMLPSGLPLSLSHADTGQAVLVVPLRATQHTLGALCVAYDTQVRDTPDQETVVLFSTQAAVAVESIELFNAVRNARDQMSSVLESTREGILLIRPDQRIAIANTALHELCSLDSSATADRLVADFLDEWLQTTTYSSDEWIKLYDGLRSVTTGSEHFVSGQLTAENGQGRSLEWSALTAHSTGASTGGSLLVLRDITQAKEAEQLRQHLIYMIIHDLRGPLTNVIASIDLLSRGIGGELSARQREPLMIALNSGRQLDEMVSNLLDINRLESGGMPLELVNADLRFLAERGIERVNAQAHERNISIMLDLPTNLRPVRVDFGLVVRVFQNLVGNAIKFSDRGGAVRVQVARPDLATTPARQIQIAISDSGVGIAPRDLDKIFDVFAQAGERRGGSGLGLTFCKLVIEAHGGRIWVESTPQVGSTFFFTLPLGSDH